MFKLFKDLFTLYWILALTIGISLAGLGAYLEKISIVILALIIPLFVMIVLEIIAQKRFKKINQIREINCNIARYYEELNQLRIKCKDKKLLSFLECNISAAFLDLGRYSDALCCLLGINIADLGKGTLGIQNQIIYFNNLAYAYIELGDFEKAEQALENMRMNIENPKISSNAANKSFWFDYYNVKKMIIQMKKGNFEGAEQFFLSMLDKATSNIHQVYESYHLAFVYMNTNRPEEAKRYIDFVLNYGGDTVYRAKTLQMKESGQGEII